MVSTPFAVLQGKSNWNYLNYEDDLCESTFHCSDFKPTPAVSEPQRKLHEKDIEKQPKEESAGPGYFLRSTVAATGSNNVRGTTEISFVVENRGLA